MLSSMGLWRMDMPILLFAWSNTLLPRTLAAPNAAIERGKKKGRSLAETGPSQRASGGHAAGHEALEWDKNRPSTNGVQSF